MDRETIACIEVGGSGAQTVLFAPRHDGVDPLDAPTIVEGIDGSVDGADLLLLAVPGIIDGLRVVGASNLGWYDVDPAEQLGLDRGSDLVLNDAEAAALGEAARRGIGDLVFVGLGTGVGGAVVRAGRVTAANLFGHARGFSTIECVCGAVGCLETVAAGWALPRPLDASDPPVIAAALARAIAADPAAARGPVVVSGGLARAYPAILDELSACLPGGRVEATAAPRAAKSAAAWGLVHAARQLDLTRP